MKKVTASQKSSFLSRSKIVSNLRPTSRLDRLPKTTHDMYDNLPDFISHSSGFIDLSAANKLGN